MKRKTSILSVFVLSLFAAVAMLPIIYTISNAFMSSDEILQYYSGLATPGVGTPFHILPDRVTLEPFYQILLEKPDYLVKFWNSLLLVTVIVCGQLIISTLAAYAFSKLRILYRNFLMFVVIVLMMMPIQVMLVANYVVLDAMHLIGNYAAVILPAVFSPFCVFLLYQSFNNIDNSIMDAARLDGANEWRILWYIAVPMSKSGLCAMVILSFVNSWNMVEQPLIFLDDRRKYPLSVFLAQAGTQNLSLGFVCGILAMLPVGLLYLFFEEELVEGINLSALK